MATYNTELEAALAAAAESAQMLASGDSIDFDGQNCEDVEEFCGGWDGNNRRCDCGNRRVSWSFTEYPKGVFSYYAEAY